MLTYYYNDDGHQNHQQWIQNQTLDIFIHYHKRIFTILLTGLEESGWNIFGKI